MSFLESIISGERKQTETTDETKDKRLDQAQPAARRVSFGFAPKAQTNQIILAK